MADFTRSVVWRFWTALLLLGDMLVHLVRAATIEDRIDYQACLASPSTCTQLSLWNNALTGTIPTEMGLMTSLTHLSLYGIQLSGTIPTEMGLMTSLTQLGLGDNSLTGTIPTEMGLMTIMQFLDIGGNALTGTIPTEMGLMTIMDFMLSLSNNAGLCGDLVSIGYAGTSYSIDGTILGNPCPSTSPAIYSRSLPCCDELRLNPLFCCIEARRPEFALSVCEEC